MRTGCRSSKAWMLARRLERALVLLSLACACLVLHVRTAQAAAPSADLLAHLAQHWQHVERAIAQGRLRATTRAEELDGDGNTKSLTETVTDIAAGKTTIVSSTKDGQDNLVEAKEAQAKRSHANSGKKGRELRSPFAAEEQPKYTFTLAATDPRVPTHVRIHFAPAAAASDELFVGDAWVDTEKGVVLRLSGAFSKNPSHVDRTYIRAEFAAQTPEGPMPSMLVFEAHGSFLWVFKKHFRVTLTVGNYVLPA